MRAVRDPVGMQSGAQQRPEADAVVAAHMVPPFDVHWDLGQGLAATGVAAAVMMAAAFRDSSEVPMLSKMYSDVVNV